MPIYEELSLFLTMDRAVTNLHTYGTTGGWEEKTLLPRRRSPGTTGHKVSNGSTSMECAPLVLIHAS